VRRWRVALGPPGGRGPRRWRGQRLDGRPDLGAHVQHELVRRRELRDAVGALAPSASLVRAAHDDSVPKLDVQRTDPLGSQGVGGGAKRVEDGQNSVDDLLAEMRLAGEFAVDVQRVAIGRPIGEPPDVLG